MALILLLWIFSLITFTSSIPTNHDITKLSRTIQQCQSGRVCMDSCYFNEQPSNCNKQDVSKFVVFDPPFNQIVPWTHLKLVRIDSDDAWFNGDVILRKENLTPRGMNIHFNLLTKSTTDIFCADWHACSLDSNEELFILIDQDVKSSFSIEKCQNGRVCTNSCYSNGQLINCIEKDILKPVLFNPPFSQIIPDIQLRLIQMKPEESKFNPDVILNKENLTLYGMNIHFSLLTDSSVYIYCADWLACSSDKI